MTTTTVLWDVDGTLLTVRGAGRRAFGVALERVWGRAFDLGRVSFAGATDLGVLAEVLGAAELERAQGVGRVAEFFDALEAALGDELARLPALALPSALETILALSTSGTPQGLLTGNEERCARLKLRTAGFDPASFTFGAYGHEHPDRDELARRAVRRRPGRHVVVGDTPRDVQAARAIGAVAVVVCTGFAPREALTAAAPDFLLDDLSGLASVLPR